ncbi:MraY family glycosyltransferase [Glutamicibacter protophormiae]|uniref:UDP-GlcNAc:undecaprenyl-phosphate GlcNAc-1-phosphate transferase n=2 Tax=Glutamicibacter protophormiae TaxID=37930 RepID=A0ABS4XRS2_GLUPR|nr:MraY family glycosyltransferase [Glutamicibacter protophormiae]MBP2399214.1 UDP-GlcNAc:undecaprenyl-phosphate GlcNAc-1-phosphate transferase [Glutamicibacter protophormiae]GGL91435.1 undecaprenyl-phosphate alpha-N-acetylglucosaminyl 1-phosphate transferase [Glutamicibacter protophormiae]
MRSYVLLIAFSFAVSFLLTPIVRSVGERFTGNQKVRARDQHEKPIVKFGGVAIIAAFALGLGLASQLSFFRGVFGNTEPITGIVLALLVILLLGLADDMFDLRWWVKALGQVLVGGIIAGHGIVIQSLPVGSWQIEHSWMQIAITIFLIVLTMNAINFSDGLDGLAAGLAAIGAATFFVYSYVLATHVSADDYANMGALLCSLLLGACLGFLPHNFNPANIFMGESGVLAIGMILSVATIAVTGDVQGLEAQRFRNIPAYMPMLLPMVIVFLPVLDLVLSVLRRLANKRSPFSPDAKHIHHKMLAQGHSVRRAVILLYLWAGFIAVSVVSIAFIPVVLMIPIVILLFLGVGLATWKPLVEDRFRALRKKLAK